MWPQWKEASDDQGQSDTTFTHEPFDLECARYHLKTTDAGQCSYAEHQVQMLSYHSGQIITESALMCHCGRTVGPGKWLMYSRLGQPTDQSGVPPLIGRRRALNSRWRS